MPRRLSGASNWAHTVESREDAIYLTTAYGLYYAIGCQGEGLPTIVEIDTSKLPYSLFAADEDGVAQMPAGQMVDGRRLSLTMATEYWRDCIEEVHPSTSLRSIGNCTFFGVIPPDAITRVLVLTVDEAMRLTLSACDPVVSVMNFRFFGETFEAVNRWFFEPVGPCPGTDGKVSPPSRAPQSLDEAAAEYFSSVTPPKSLR